ncbi:hypothetical protein ACLMJK_006446 [Lecanora helva]
MNWTGGRLSRSRNAKGSLTAKQKDYFAKARNNLQDGRMQRPQVQTFELGEWKPALTLKSPCPSHPSSMARQSSQKTLDEFENVQPVVRQLSSLQPRTHSNKRKRVPLHSSSSPVDERDGGAARRIVIDSNQSHSSEFPEKSPHLQSSRLGHSNAGITKDMSLEAKRRRLLEMNDWVGIHAKRPATNPVKMKFTDPKDRDLIGRRRKIVDQSHDDGLRKQLVSRRTPLLDRGLRSIPAPYGPCHPVDEVSVRIGSAVDRSTRDPSNGSTRHGRRQNSVFSDELLDNGTPLMVGGASQPMMNGTRQAASSWSPDRDHRDALPHTGFLDDSWTGLSTSSHSQTRHSFSSSSAVRSLESGYEQLLEASSQEALPKAQSPKGLRLMFESPAYHRASRATVDDVHSLLEEIATPTPIKPAKRNRSVANKNQKSRAMSPCQGYTIPVPISLFNVDDTGSRKLSEAQAESGHKQLTRAVQSNGNDTQAGGSPTNQLIQHTDDALPATSSPGHQHHNPLDRAQPERDPSPGCEEDAVWKDFITLDKLDDDKNSSKTDPHLHETLPPTPKPCTQPLLPTNPPKPLEDEEAAWRKFVFGNDDDISEDASQQSSDHENSNRALCTQPSLIAEAATSPLKQNPHLVDGTFNPSSSSYLGEAILSEPPPNCSSSKMINTSSSHTHTSINPNGPSSPPPHSPTPSSLIAQAPTTTFSLSSDELHRSPDRVPFNPPPLKTNNENHNSRPAYPNHFSPSPEKILYKPPPRYHNPGFGRPVAPIRLGARVLRSGRTTGQRNGGKGVGRGREGARWRGRGNGRGGEEGDEIVDD